MLLLKRPTGLKNSNKKGGEGMSKTINLTVTYNLTVKYEGGIDQALDAKLISFLEKEGWKETGSGCMMIAPYERDISFEKKVKEER